MATGRPEHPPELADRPTDAEADMPKARAFFYVCAGIFLLALSYHLGARNATAQAPSNPIVAAETGLVYMANGDAYSRDLSSGCPVTFIWCGNVFGGGPPTPTQQGTWGSLKAKYRGER